ncbi:protein kinase domain-containing protein [Acinetobacter baumannii]|uniref:protein kinase domain-containing protein n=1 Tax=Acinetobacter baumannii TaxID=470 RepID=UPI000810BA2A|nr:protein kinase [Acinetobacter baumannii]MDC4786622.1 protein kinase [Acinetobacter baumannii]MDV7233282.1 protein kinase [Acinetobacter baumannii]
MEIKVLKKLLKGLGEHGFGRKYKLIKSLNNGGNSHSYKAYSYSLRKNVFIKFFLLPRHEIELLKFRNEIAIHKLIARQGYVYDKNAVIEFVDSKIFNNELGGYLVLEWLDGKPLDIVIKEYSKRDIDQKIQLFHRVANALIPLSNWITHRDLHPSNIMVLDKEFDYEQLRDNAYNPLIKVVDFGESYSSYVTTVSDLENSDLKKISESNSRRLTTSLYSTPPEYLKRYRGDNQNNIFDKSWNYDSWALGLIGFKIFFNEDVFEFEDIKDYVDKLKSAHFQLDIECKISYEFSKIHHKQSKLLENILKYLLRVDPTQRTGDGNVGLVLYLTNFKGYVLPENSRTEEYMKFIRGGWDYLDSKKMTRLEDIWSYD